VRTLEAVSGGESTAEGPGATACRHVPGSNPVPDLYFVLLILGVFVLLGLATKGLEKL